MRKIILRVAVLIASFFVGLGSFILVFLYFNAVPEIAAPDPLPAECAESKSFPGLSKGNISEIEKGKSGYFPKGRFAGGWAESDNFTNDWYGKHLKAMTEESLLDAADEAEIYRFLWLRTFHHPVFVKVVRHRNEIKLFTKELDGAGGYEPGKVLRSDEITLKHEDFCRFLNLLEKADYWNLGAENNDSGVDGSQWILEGVKKGRYHLVDRWTPETGKYREACLFLLKLSGVDTDRLKGDLY